ncbi:MULTISPECIES: peptide ABC transporter substrate-binding protein [Lactobacillaceae]|uniref:peptide ABC transporter substrate-binding protein n=1 Tax=Lactobacillaceae TaxID=33958 RepID=UPI001E50D054|nr:peptide ABC transporter substrate-binding protein [Lactobacillus sp. HBUAS51381]
MKRWGILIILIFCSALSGCTISHETDTPSDSKGVMTKNQVLTLASHRPLTTLDTDKLTQFGRLNNTIEGLYQANGDRNPELALAKSVKVNAARTTYTFTLWKDSYWSNGDVITAPDFVFSWRRALAPTTKAPEADLFDGFQNARKILDGKLPANQLGVSAPSRFKLVVHLEHPMAELPQKLAYPLFGPQNRRIAKKYGRLYATKPRYQVYAGPFMVDPRNSTPDRWHMVPNPHYWDRKHVYLSRINVETYRSIDAAWDAYDHGDLDEIRLLGKADTKYFEKKADYTARPYSKMVLLNYRQTGSSSAINRLLRQKIARLAISHAINRKALVKQAYGDTSLAAQGVVPAGLSRGLKGTADFAAAQPEQAALAYHPKLARQEWQTAQQRADLTHVTLTLSYLDGTNSGSAARTLRRQLQDKLPGLTVVLKKREQTINKLAAPVNSDLTLTTQRAQYADPLAMLSLFTSSNTANIGHWSNQAYDKLIDEASNAPSFNSRRWKNLLAAEGMLMRDQGVTPLVQPASTYLVNSKLNGVIYNTVGTQSNFKSAYFVK